MIAELGLAALWLAAAVSLLQLAVPSLGLWRDDERLWRFARPAGVVQALLGLLSFACLIRLFAVTDLSVLRSEEHTSELQSLMRISYAVFCLKKKKQNNTKI